MLFSTSLVAVAALCSVAAALPPSYPHHYPVTPTTIVNQTSCNGKTYTYNQMAGYGFIPNDARDKFGDTIGGIGSGITFDKPSWTKLRNGSYVGIIWVQPDRGWNTEGTLNFQPRIHKYEITLIPQRNATVTNPSGPNILLKYLDTILFTGPDGTPTTGLDADASGSDNFTGFPPLPVADYTGDGFGRPGPGGRRIPIDAEGVHLNYDGTFWTSDEYGPYIYRFSPEGRMLSAIQPPAAILPMRNGSLSFSADSPPEYDPNFEVIPANPVTGRANNQGFEGLTISPDGRTMYALLQSALDQEGGVGSDDSDERNARLVIYDLSGRYPVYRSEYVVTLPIYNTTSSKGNLKTKTAKQSEIHYLSPTQFLVLARDSDAGHGQASSLSVYRHADIFDISNATDIRSATNDAANGSIASIDGVLNPGIVPAQYCTFLDYNVNSQLNRFGVHNGGNQDQFLLNEKWESLATVPVNPGIHDGQYFLFSFSDNDFITQNGFLDGGNFTYADSSGYNLDNQALAFQIQIPRYEFPS